MYRIWSLVLFLCLVLAAGPALAAGYKDISAREVKVLMDQGNALVVFPLSRIEYNNLHITGSVHIPLSRLSQELPPDKNKPLVFYCLGIECTASPEGAEIAAGLGYRQVYAFRGGLPEWIGERYPVTTLHRLPNTALRMISPEDLQAALARGEELVVLDVRNAFDLEQGWIDHRARLAIPLDDLLEREQEIPRDRKIVVTCLKGKRSPAAVRYLVSKGFQEVYCLDGGMSHWIASGLPVRKAKGGGKTGS